MKVRALSQPSVFEFVFLCPACCNAHGFRTIVWPMPPGLNDDDKELFERNKWTWNGDFDNPTIHPSINTLRKIGTDKKGKPIYETECHSFVKEGKIQFLGDCKHDKKNQTIDLPEF